MKSLLNKNGMKKKTFAFAIGALFIFWLLLFTVDILTNNEIKWLDTLTVVVGAITLFSVPFLMLVSFIILKIKG